MSFPRSHRPGHPPRRPPSGRRARTRSSHLPGPAFRLLAREWAWTSSTSLVVALLAGLRALAAHPQWDTGDLLVGLYFAAVSLLFWVRASWIRIGRAVGPTARGYIITLVVALGVGGVLVLADVLSGGRF